MGMFAIAAANVAGGVGAAVLDRQFADKSVSVGPITLTPGALFALGGIAAGMVGVPLPTVLKQAVAGALIYEGTKLGEQQVVPLVERMFPGASAPAPAVTAGEDYVGMQDNRWLSTGLPNTDHDVQNAIMAFRMS